MMAPEILNPVLSPFSPEACMRSGYRAVHAIKRVKIQVNLNALIDIARPITMSVFALSKVCSSLLPW
jgi:hypothetical protein